MRGTVMRGSMRAGRWCRPPRPATMRAMTNRSALIAWLLGVMAVGIGGLIPDGYRRHVAHATGADAYPATGVAQFIAVVTVEVLVLWLIGRWRAGRPSLARALVALALVVPVTLVFGMALMHAPPYQAAHFNWSVGLVLALLVGAVGPGVSRYRARRAGRRAT